MAQKRFLGFAGLALLLAMSGCGKKGPTAPPGPADQIIYPKTYPTH